MKQLKDVDFSKTFGDVPESFSSRVQYALRRTEEEKPVKRTAFRTVIAVALLVMLAATAAAAVLSHTVDWFADFYGDDFANTLNRGDVASGGQSFTLDEVVYTLSDVVAAPYTVQQHAEGSNEPVTYETMAIFATGVITPAEGVNLVLMPMDDYSVSDPYACDLYYGTMDAPASAAPTYADKAKELGASIRMVSCIPNGVMGENGELLPASLGYTLIPQSDGSVHFSVEIIPDAPLAKQDSYTLSLWLGHDQVDLDNTIVKGSRASTDWLVTVEPEISAK